MTKMRFALIGALISLFVAGGLLYLAAPVHAQGICQSDAKRVPNGSLNRVDLCEKDGIESETGASQFAFGSTPRYVVVMDCGDPANASDRNNQANWSDVVRIFRREGIEAQLLSKGSPSFPTVVTVTATNNAVFIRETTTGLGVDDAFSDDTVYSDGVNEFHIHSAARLTPCAPAQVPEGDTLMLVGTGLAGLAGYAALRWRARRAL